VHALHILRPTPYPYAYAAPGLIGAALEAEEENAREEMRKIESQLAGLKHDTVVQRGTSIWPGVDQAIRDGDIDLVIVGTHGRTGADKLLLGSVAEEILRRSPVAVLTIGPHVRGGVHNGARFHRVLFATDLTPESLAGAQYAVSLARDNQSHLVLLLVMGRPEHRAAEVEAVNRVHEIVPHDVKLEFPAEVAVEYGEPAERIVKVAKNREADLIVLGVRKTAHMGAAIHLERAIAHKVVAHAPCPVLTVRG